jgi:Flp pilus assembly pilin Flp
MAKGKTFLSKLIRRNSGVAAVEFAIVLPVLILIITGMMDLGHAFYLKQIITNASREGARYGILYVSKPDGHGSAIRIPPSQLVPSIQDWILNPPPPQGDGQCNLTTYLKGDDSQAPAPTVTPGGAGYNSGATGDDLIVTVQYKMNWWILDKFIPGLPNPLTLSATTTMRVE